ncbi:MAG: L-glyceraldehyde 3-phosphate reductase [Bacteroidales bacterium]
MTYQPSDNRYDTMQYRRTGNSGLLLPAISLGLWHNFGHVDDFENARKIIHEAFDSGITHFDLANNYGPPPGAAEENFAKILRDDFKGYRNEMIISTKAGYYMWPGPYGEWGSRKYIIASCDQSLRRLGLDHVDIFYSHRFDPLTPLEETMGALDTLVKHGKTLYVGISNYPAEHAIHAINILENMGTPCLIHQPRYSMLERTPESGLFDALERFGVGCIAFSPLAQGLLTDKYMNNIPANSRASKDHGFLKKEHITPLILEKVKLLNEIAAKRGQSLAQMALAWILKEKRVTSVLVGASSAEQLNENIKSLDNISFTSEELDKIEFILAMNKI